MNFKNHGWMMHGGKVRKELYQRQAEKNEEYDLRIRRLQHDMKSHMIALLGMVQAKDTEGAEAHIRSLLDECGQYGGENAVHCGNIVIDSLMNYGAALAGREGIFFDADIILPIDLPFQNRHLAAVFGNLIENALEGCRQIENQERWVKVRASYVKEILMVTVRNSCDGKRIQEQGGHFRTTKRNAWDHGSGLSSVEQAVGFYHGQVETEYGEGVFQVTVIMYGSEVENDTVSKLLLTGKQ